VAKGVHDDAWQTLMLSISEAGAGALGGAPLPDLLWALLQASPLATLAVDEKGRTLLWSASAEELLGWRAREVIGRRAPLFPEEPSSDGSALASTILAGACRGREVRARCRDGRWLDLALWSAPLRDDAIGDVVGAVIQLVDDSARKAAERERGALVAEERERHRSADAAHRRARLLAEVSAALAGPIDGAGALARVTELIVAACADWCMVDLFSDASHRGNLARVAIAHRDPSLAWAAECLQREGGLHPLDEAALTRLLHSGGPVSLLLDDAHLERVARSPAHLAALKAAGASRVVAHALAARGKQLGIILFAHAARAGESASPEAADLELGRELAARVAAAVDNVALYQSSVKQAKACADLLAVVSHDLKNPLTSIRLNARLIHDTISSESSASTRRRARSIERITEQMDRLVHGLLDLQAAEAGTLELHLGHEDLRTIVDETLAMLQPLALERSIHVLREDGVGSHVVRCDRERIRQVVSNLVGNAIKFAPQRSSIVVRLSSGPTEERLAVSDRGPGIPPAQLERVFDRYYRGGAQAPGSGLGLAIAKAIVSAHGGRVWAESVVGVGSTFAVALPR
jgi:PAS domain S-box-containing protein